MLQFNASTGGVDGIPCAILSGCCRAPSIWWTLHCASCSQPPAAIQGGLLGVQACTDVTRWGQGLHSDQAQACLPMQASEATKAARDNAKGSSSGWPLTGQARGMPHSTCSLSPMGAAPSHLGGTRWRQSAMTISIQTCKQGADQSRLLGRASDPSMVQPVAHITSLTSSVALSAQLLPTFAGPAL